MKKWFAVFLVSASPLSAHSGGHLHPHGNDPFWVVAALVLVLAVFGVFAMRRK